MRLVILMLGAALLLWLPTQAQTENPSPPPTQTGTVSKAAVTPAEVLEAARLNAQVVELFKGGKFDDALPLAQQVLALREKALAPGDRRIGDALLNLASVYFEKKDNNKAEPLFQRALTIYETALGAESEGVVGVLGRLMVIRYAKTDYDKAASLEQRIIVIKEKQFGVDGIGVVADLLSLANIYAAKGDFSKSRLSFARALTILEKANLTALPVGVGESLANYLTLLYRQRQTDEVRAQIERANKIYAAVSVAGGGKGLVQGGVLTGRAVYMVQPAYPLEAKRARAQGTVVVHVTVDESGRVVGAEAISNSNPYLKDAAVAAARKWRFTPTLLIGAPVKVTGTISFVFNIQ